ncbi:hypothetical protein C0995_001504 [Termitomyces sp. Mi166|nr:hypothetical protein C0995_001504 [Termitomyces sp. Mi166\
MPLVTSRAVRWPDNLPYDKQSVPVPGTKRPGQTGVWGLTDINTPNVLKTLDEIFESGLSAGKDQPFLGHRPVISTNPLKYAPQYAWETYGNVDLRRRNVGSALGSLFAKGELGGGEFNTVGIWSANRPGIVHCAFGMRCSEINHAHLTVIFSTSDHIPTLLKLASKLPFMKLIVCIDDLTPEAKQILTEWATSQNVQLKQLREVEIDGKVSPLEPIRATPDAVASICYTSGTTSDPKGVVLTHGNLALATQSNLYGIELPDAACLISYLPLAHIYERICELCIIAIGGKIGYYTGDPLRLLEDVQLLKPDFFPSVPRVLNRVYQAAMAGGNVPGLKGNLFRKAIQVKLDKLHTTGDPTHFFWDKLVFRKIQAVLGGQIKLVTSGSAPISPDVMDFLKIAFACEVYEVIAFVSPSVTNAYDSRYGMTENCATCAAGWPNDATSSGTVGPPQPVNEIKLVDVPTMGYTSEDKPNPRGELCVRGANCFKVYHKDEKSTKATIDEEGWLHTGDVGELDQAGRIKIIDRVKNIMKLAQGEYVALEKIENLYSSSPVIAQIYVHGDSLQSYLLAVIIPDPVQLAALASKIYDKNIMPEDLQELALACRDERVNEEILAVMTKEAKRNGLKGSETIKKIHLSLDGFSVEDGTLTPTMKIRRKDAYNKFKRELDKLYALGEPSSSKL